MVQEEKKEHINILELRAIYYALKNMEEIVKGKRSQYLRTTRQHCPISEGKGGRSTFSTKGQVVTTNWTLNSQVCQSLRNYGGDSGGRVCSSPDEETPKLLCLASGPQHSRGRCSATGLEPSRPVRISALRNDKEGQQQSKRIKELSNVPIAPW